MSSISQKIFPYKPIPLGAESSVEFGCSGLFFHDVLHGFILQASSWPFRRVMETMETAIRWTSMINEIVLPTSREMLDLVLEENRYKYLTLSNYLYRGFHSHGGTQKGWLISWKIRQKIGMMTGPLFWEKTTYLCINVKIHSWDLKTIEIDPWQKDRLLWCWSISGPPHEPVLRNFGDMWRHPRVQSWPKSTWLMLSQMLAINSHDKLPGFQKHTHRDIYIYE